MNAPPIFSGGYIAPAFLTDDTDPLILVAREGDVLRLPAGTAVAASQARRLTITQVNGLKGTVKEMAGFEDWQVSVSGNFVSAGYIIGVPSIIMQVRRLNSFWKRESELTVTNMKLNSLGITTVVMERIDIPDAPSDYMQPFSFTLLSDIALDLDQAGLDSKAEALGAVL